MARFYAEIQGSRGEASRLGTASSGMHGHVRGWHVGAAVDMYAEGDNDRAAVYATAGSAGYSREAIGSIRNVDGMLELTPSPWLLAQVDAYRRKQRNEARRERRAAAKLAATFPRQVETAYGTVTIHAASVAVSAASGQVYAWAHRPGAAWPCSTLAHFDSLCSWFDSNGLVDLQAYDAEADNYDTTNVDGSELSAYCADVLAAANLPASHPCYDVAVAQFLTKGE